MKLLVLILAIAIVAQPLQAGFCGMDTGSSQETQQQMDGASGNGHDCCDEADTDAQQEQGCDGNVHCAPCFVSAPVLPTIARLQLNWAPQHAECALPGLVLSNHSSPPFRPPIS